MLTYTDLLDLYYVAQHSGFVDADTLNRLASEIAKRIELAEQVNEFTK